MLHLQVATSVCVGGGGGRGGGGEYWYRQNPQIEIVEKPIFEHINQFL